MPRHKNPTPRQISKVPPQKNPTARDKNSTPRQTPKVPPQKNPTARDKNSTPRQTSKVPLQFFNFSILQFFQVRVTCGFTCGQKVLVTV
jgi:hypothetical protein